MPDNRLLKCEADQFYFEPTVLTDLGDHLTYQSQADRFSAVSGKEPKTYPDGFATGTNPIIAVSKSNDAIDIPAQSYYLAGVKLAIGTTLDKVVSRPATDVASISALTVDGSGSFVFIKGDDGTDLNFSAVRGAPGGPPFIPLGSIERSHIKLTSATSQPIRESEVVSILGVSIERFDKPLYSFSWGDGRVVFKYPLPAIHEGSKTKSITIQCYEPIFVELDNAADFVPSENSISVSSKEYYSSVVNNVKVSLSQGGFSLLLENGITDPIFELKGEKIWLLFYNDKYKPEHIYDHGVLGIKTTFTPSENPTAQCSIASTIEAQRKAE